MVEEKEPPKRFAFGSFEYFDNRNNQFCNCPLKEAFDLESTENANWAELNVARRYDETVYHMFAGPTQGKGFISEEEARQAWYEVLKKSEGEESYLAGEVARQLGWDDLITRVKTEA
jgi:hypothetical protein